VQKHGSFAADKLQSPDFDRRSIMNAIEYNISP
jgi:hypothetical protein